VVSCRYIIVNTLPEGDTKDDDDDDDDNNNNNNNNKRIKELQNTAILGTANILLKVLI
jgi:hypothetical protein